jgi:hypothetical protein
LVLVEVPEHLELTVILLAILLLKVVAEVPVHKIMAAEVSVVPT